MRQLGGMSPEAMALARDTVRLTVKIEDNDDYLTDVKTVIRALEFVEHSDRLAAQNRHAAVMHGRSTQVLLTDRLKNQIRSCLQGAACG
ncbi:hypothetical protein LB524_14320 [Mesorhizobium sp. ESP6-5]|uniref:hypothetical protein n=1 Tax=Mesorhizobium sp. ESP6-5 TaxID=2876623 RepID=UPI001CCAC590|nr:hypothetical protein [Mesorhizobium sp. ESP6-5]MBZ9756469.1 hypothetical protein [Mesorhizobium sp. ESP6-5]